MIESQAISFCIPWYDWKRLLMHQHLNQDYMYTLLNYTITTTNDFFVYPSSCDRFHRVYWHLMPTSRALQRSLKQSAGPFHLAKTSRASNKCSGRFDLATSQLDDVQISELSKACAHIIRFGQRFEQIWPLLVTLAIVSSWACGLHNR